MATEIKLPALGENVDSGTVVKILVSPGDKVTEDQPVLDLETEKASVEVPASASGTVKEIRVKEGDTIKVGHVLLTLEDGGETKGDSAQLQTAERDRAQPQVTKEDKPKSDDKENSQGKSEKKPEAEKEVEETAEAQEAKGDPAPPPRPKSEKQTEPEEVRDKRDKAQPQAEKTPPKKHEEKVEPIEKEKPQPESAQVVPAAPAVRRMARELGINISEVTGTGPDGRISEADVRNHARSIILNAILPSASAQPDIPELPDFTRWGETDRQPMNNVRRKTAEHVSQAWLSIPHVTHFDSADITELERLRQEFANKVEEAGGKLTITAIVLKVIGAALKVFPQFNASLDAGRDEIVYKKYYNVGVATNTERGLLVPVIRDVDKKNILDLSVELTQIAEKARNKKLGIEDMRGGTFTLTNVGAIGGTGFTPIINAPDVAILGICRANQQPLFRDGQFSPRLMLPLALSFDHRVIDGADAARFLRWVCDALQQPFMLTFEG